MADISKIKLPDNSEYNIKDSTISSWARAATKPTYTASEVGALPSTTTIPTASTTAPLMDGTASYGSGTAYARSNHVHPTDTSRQATLVSGTNIKTLNNTSLLGSGNIALVGLPTVTTADNGKVLTVVNGTWAAASLPVYTGESTFVPAATGESF